MSGMGAQCTHGGIHSRLVASEVLRVSPFSFYRPIPNLLPQKVLLCVVCVFHTPFSFVLCVVSLVEPRL